jgi:hypothetical protein
MAALTITPANVAASSNAQLNKNGIAGVAITQGQALYKDTDGSMKLCVANGASPAYVFAGIALNAAAAGQPITYVTTDPDLNLGVAGGIATGTALVTSDTPGGIAPVTDVGAGQFVTVLGVVDGDGNLNLAPVASNAAHA